MSSRVLISKDIGRLANDIRFHRELNNKQHIQKQIYFDTAGIIDMLTGLAGMSKGRIKWEIYDQHSTLVNALAFKNWLGPIHILSPHAEELIHKIQNDADLFPENNSDDFVDLKNQFWSELNLKINDLKKVKEFDVWVSNLKSDSIDLFKGVYLGSHDSFWKKRYKYLKDEKILNFLSGDEYQLIDITNRKLFNALHKFLNNHREKSHNNYIDTIALCLLDEKLRQFEAEDSEKKNLPIFFSDQDHILKAAKYFSTTWEEDENGHIPFIYRGENNKFNIVRDANFFVIDGIFKALREKDSPEDYKNFVNALDQISTQLTTVAPNASKNPLTRIVNEDLKRDIRNRFRNRSEEKVFLEFFDRWWKEDGYSELKLVIRPELLENKGEIDDHIHLFIEQERKRLNEQFNNYSDRISLIKKIWNKLFDLEGFIRQSFSEDVRKLDINKELGPRFSYTEEVCESIQNTTNRIFNAVSYKNNNDHVLQDIKENIVTDILISLFENIKSEKEEINQLNRICKSLGILWVFEKYDLIGDICKIIRKRHERQNVDNDDKYPNPSLALMHAASFFLGRKKDEQEALHIMKCVEKKYGDINYKAWIGLSYLYYLLWDENQDVYDFPELAKFKGYEYENNQLYRQYLEKALFYCTRALKWLEERRKDINSKEKIKYRQRKYYYVLNNYIFFQVILSSPSDFPELIHYADKLEQIARNADYWQEARFSDTLARFFYRLSFFSESQKEFNLNVNTAMLYNEASMKSTKREKKMYRTLDLNLRRLKTRGLSDLSNFSV